MCNLTHLYVREIPALPDPVATHASLAAHWSRLRVAWLSGCSLDETYRRIVIWSVIGVGVVTSRYPIIVTCFEKSQIFATYNSIAMQFLEEQD